MKIKTNLKKFGFSLMELTLAVLIVAILVVITLPIINRQLEKSEEYSYYLAYKTVEKMAGQIVALGDPDPEEEHYTLKYQKTPFKDVLFAKIDGITSKLSLLTKSYKEKLANSEIFVFTKLFPKTMAEEVMFVSWNEDAFDDLWLGYYVCNKASSSGTSTVSIENANYTKFTNEDSDITKAKHERKRTIKNSDGTTSEETYTEYEYYSVSDFNCCSGYTHGNAVCRAKSKQKETLGEYIEAESGDTNAIVVNGKKYVRVYYNRNANDMVKELFFPDYVACGYSMETDAGKNNFNAAVASLANDIINIGYEEIDGINVLKTNASKFCTYQFYNKCSKNVSMSFKQIDYSNNNNTLKRGEESDDGEEEVEDTGDKAPKSYKTYVSPIVPLTGQCQGFKIVNENSSNAYGSYSGFTRPTYSSSWCSDYRANGKQIYFGMTNAAAPDSIDCQPISGYILAANNEKYAAEPCPEGQTLYAAFDSSSNTYSRVCTAYDFNEFTQKPCGEHSVYSGGETCECVSGWTKNAVGECSVIGTCPRGTTKSADGNTCVQNPPIISARRFCELVVENWNVSTSTCNNFATGVYENVYKAALGNDTNKTYLSIQSQPNAFKSLTPNLRLANGLKVWILGNKAASIPGLSYYSKDASTPISKNQNMCKRVSLTTHTAEACGIASDNKGYFCSTDKNCFELDESSYAASGTTRTTELLDARGCCAAPDFTDFHEAAKGDTDIYLKDPTVYSIGGYTIFVDINGDKGEGTLWEDVFPFFISSNGIVYPAYPLDAEKDKFKSDETTETGNALYLGGNSDKQLPTDVYYYEPATSGEARERKIAFANVSFARAMCSARKISKYTPYCMNLGKKYSGKGIFPKTTGGYEEVDLPEDYIAKGKNSVKAKDSHNPCDYFVCYVAVKNKLRFF